MVIGGAVGVLAAVAEAAPKWSVTPPVGWQDVTTQAREDPAFQAKQARLHDRGGETEIAVYLGDDEARLAITYLEMARSEDTPLQSAHNAEGGWHDRMAAAGKEVSYTPHNDGVVLAADQVVTVADRPQYARRLSGVTASRIVSVMGLCIGPKAQCDPALQSLAIDRSSLLALAGGGITVDTGSDAYRKGAALGNLALALIGVVVLTMVLVRRRRSRARAS
jgi:hypothetical protein